MPRRSPKPAATKPTTPTLLCVQVLEAKPNQLFSEEQRESVRFLRYNQSHPLRRVRQTPKLVAAGPDVSAIAPLLNQADRESAILIETGEWMTDPLPGSARKLVEEWVRLHKAELLENWELCRMNEQPMPISPLP
jgi:hypothetical protein